MFSPLFASCHSLLARLVLCCAFYIFGKLLEQEEVIIVSYMFVESCTIFQLFLKVLEELRLVFSKLF